MYKILLLKYRTQRRNAKKWKKKKHHKRQVFDCPADKNVGIGDEIPLLTDVQWHTNFGACGFDGRVDT